MKKILFLPIFVFILIGAYTGISAHALAYEPVGTTIAGDQTTGNTAFQPLTNVQGTPFARLFASSPTLKEFFQTLFNISITIGALLAVLMLAYSGWQYMTSDILNKKSEARTRIQNALLGLLMLLATVLILRQINPDIVSLSILNNTGSPTTQQQTRDNNNPFTDQGFETTSPNGYFCVDLGNTNPAQTSVHNYECYTSATACGQQNGLCQGYSTNGTYFPGVNHPSALSSTTASEFAEFDWVNNAGTDSSGSLLSCSAVKGSGWTEVESNMCGGARSTPTGQCCALSKDAAASLTATSTVAGEKFATDEQQFIAPGKWCYVDKTNTYSCFDQKNSCSTDLTIATSSSKASATTKCVVRTNKATWAIATTSTNVSILGYSQPQKGMICGDGGDGSDLGIDTSATRYACGYPSVTACKVAQNHSLINCQQY